MLATDFAAYGLPSSLILHQQENLHLRQLTLSGDELAAANWRGTLRNSASCGYGRGRN
jgi:hypothetical protein